MSSGSRAHTHPPVGILCKSLSTAQALARELHVKKAIPLSPTTINAKTVQELGVLLVEDSCWPLTPLVSAVVMPSLARGAGYLIRLERYDPKKQPGGN